MILRDLIQIDFHVTANIPWSCFLCACEGESCLIFFPHLDTRINILSHLYIPECAQNFNSTIANLYIRE